MSHYAFLEKASKESLVDFLKSLMAQDDNIYQRAKMILGDGEININYYNFIDKQIALYYPGRYGLIDDFDVHKIAGAIDQLLNKVITCEDITQLIKISEAILIRINASCELVEEVCDDFFELMDKVLSIWIGRESMLTESDRKLFIASMFKFLRHPKANAWNYGNKVSKLLSPFVTEDAEKMELRKLSK